MFCRAGVLFLRKKEKAPDPIFYGTEDFRGATHVAGMNRPLLCAVRGAPPGSSPQAPKVEKRFCPAGFHQPPALCKGAAAASFLMAYIGVVYPIPPQIASPVPGLSYCAPALGNRTKDGWLQSGKESMPAEALRHNFLSMSMIIDMGEDFFS